MSPGRDDLGRLICQVPTKGKPCGAKINALTGLIELQKLSQHFHRKHPTWPRSMSFLLDLRAKWETPPIPGSADAEANAALRKRGT